jgi:starvation-inducible outer membrane lipoprotein
MHRHKRGLLIGMVVLAAFCLAGCRSDPPNMRDEQALAAQPQVQTTADGRQMVTMPAPPGGVPSPGDTFVNPR